MTQSLELLLDDQTEAAVRREWRLLANAGLPSQERHRSSTNRPHVTLAAESAIAPAVDAALADLVPARLPLDLHVGAMTLFGSDHVVLVRLVVPTRELLTLHAEVAEAVGADPASVLAPGRWTPHVTLATRLPRARIPEALAVLAAGTDRPDRPGADSPARETLTARAVAARRWDSEARHTWRLGSEQP